MRIPNAMTNLWKAGIAAGGAAAGILVVRAVVQIDDPGRAVALGAAALAVGALTIALILRPGTGVARGPELRVTALTIFLLTLAFGLMIGAAGGDGHGHG